MELSSDHDLLFREEVFRIQGAAFAVSNKLGHGFLEAVYQECLEIELLKSSVPFTAMPKLSLVYDGVPLRQTY